MSEPEEIQLNLKWDNFSSHLALSFDSCYESQQFVDVSLVCKDGEVIKGHKMILANTSRFFRRLLTENEHPHPMIVLHNIDADDLRSLMTFMYCGEVQVFQNDLKKLLEIADTLEITGLQQIQDIDNQGNRFTKNDTDCEMNTNRSNKPASHLLKYVSNLGQKNLDNSVQSFESSSKKLQQMAKKFEKCSNVGSWSFLQQTPNSNEARIKEISNDNPLKTVRKLPDGETDVNLEFNSSSRKLQEMAKLLESINRNSALSEVSKGTSEGQKRSLDFEEAAESPTKKPHLTQSTPNTSEAEHDADIVGLNAAQDANAACNKEQLIESCGVFIKDELEVNTDCSTTPDGDLDNLQTDNLNATNIGEHSGTSMLAAELLKAVANKRKDERVAGISSREITEGNLKELRHKSGPKKRLLNLINEPDRIECLIDPSVAPLQYDTEDFNLVENRNTRIVGKFTPIEISRLISGEATSSLRIYSSEQGKYECQRINSETSVSVREWVERNDAKQMRNPTLVSILDSGVVEPKHRRELVRVVCTELIKLNDSMYPPTSLKKHVAKEIIKAFPKLRSTHPGGEGHEHFYDAKNNHGFIEFRLKTLRVSLSPSKKKRASPSAAKNLKGKKGLPVPKADNESRNECLNENDFDEKVLELSTKIPNHTNIDEIFRLTDETRPNRQKEIRDSETSLRVSVDDILQKYPRFKDFCGELIHREFVAEFPGNDKFLTNFVSFYVPRILKYCSSTRPELLESAKDIHDDNLKALILIPELLPIPNFTKRMKLQKKSEDGKRKGKVKSKAAAQCNFSAKIIPNENLLQYVNPAHDFLLENPTTAKELENVQPFLVCCMTGGEKKGVFFIRTNEHLIEIGSDGMTAFDILLKLHYCFNVQFAADLIYFYDFITSCVLQFSSPKACCSALNTTLQNISLSDASFPNNNSGDLSISESEAEVLSENDNF